MTLHAILAIVFWFTGINADMLMFIHVLGQTGCISHGAWSNLIQYAEYRWLILLVHGLLVIGLHRNQFLVTR